MLARFLIWKDEHGASMVEYALLVVLIAIVAIIAVTMAGQNVSQTFETIGNALEQASGE